MADKKRFDYSSLDVVGLLKSMGIEMDFTGKNVTRGWVNTNCPFCQDPSNHLGINLSSKNVSCWICREHGTFWKYIKAKTRKDNKEIYRLLKPFLVGGVQYVDYDENKTKNEKVVLPTHLYDEPLKIHKEYLLSRNFKPSYLQRIYGIKYSGQVSKYKTQDRVVDFRFRIIIPIYINGKLVNFTARDVTDTAEEKYKNCPIDDVLLTTKDCIYGYDTLVGDTAVIVEGPTDVWNMGPGSCGLFGLKYTDTQIKLLYSRNLKKAVVFMDNEATAQKTAKTLAYELGSFIGNVFIMEPDSNISDPGSMTQDQVRKFWELIGR